MKEKISVKEREFSLVTKTGMEDDNGKVIIPREYDRIIKINDNLFAAIEDSLNSGIITVSHGIIEKSNLTKRGLELLWRAERKKEEPGTVQTGFVGIIANKDEKKEVSAVNIDFYTLEGKLECKKKVLAYYYSEENNLLIVLGEDCKWSIMRIEPITQSLVVYKDYERLDDIKEIYGGRFLIRRNHKYEIVGRPGKDEPELCPFMCHAVEPHEKGLLITDDSYRHSFVTYSGKIIVDYFYGDIIPRDDYILIRTRNECRYGIFSYEGENIIPCEYFSIADYDVLNTKLFVLQTKKGDGSHYWQIATMEGKIFDKTYMTLSFQPDGRMIYCEGGFRWGMKQYVDDGRLVQILPAEYDHISWTSVRGSTMFVCVRKGKKYAIYTPDGTMYRGFKSKRNIPQHEKIWYD